VHGIFLPSAPNTDVIPIFLPNNPGILAVIKIVNNYFSTLALGIPCLATLSIRGKWSVVCFEPLSSTPDFRHWNRLSVALAFGSLFLFFVIKP
jgi:hypothetical protein